MNHNFSKFMYIAFILLGAYYSIFKHDYLEAGATFGIALAFDPSTKKLHGTHDQFGKEVY